MIGGPETLDHVGLVLAGVVGAVALLYSRRLGLVVVVLLLAPFVCAASAYVGIRWMLSGDPADGLDLARYVQLVIAMRRAVLGLPVAIVVAGMTWVSSRAWRRWRGRAFDRSGTGGAGAESRP